VLSASKGCICPEGSYIDTSDVETVCTACSGFCAICSSEFDCTVCKATFIYSTSAKECICPFNYYKQLYILINCSKYTIYYLTSAYKCEPCHSKCRGCQFSPDNCLQCAPDSGTPPSCTCPSSPSPIIFPRILKKVNFLWLAVSLGSKSMVNALLAK
jgi:proprotein convertase subtilisin/kexin type 5